MVEVLGEKGNLLQVQMIVQKLHIQCLHVGMGKVLGNWLTKEKNLLEGDREQCAVCVHKGRICNIPSSVGQEWCQEGWGNAGVGFH